ncbi:MAG: hypothetical protein IJV95_03055 [Clostridia bacterium]|nr:hypothetical protein [Clostridia bacterium]
MEQQKKSLTITLCVILASIMLAFTLTPYFTAKPAYAQRYSDDTFNGGGTATVADEIIEFDSYTVLEDCHVSSGDMPSYGDLSEERDNTCSPVAGANICGYYDRWKTNLLPDFTPGANMGTGYCYFNLSGQTPVQNCIGTLYNYMGTNVGGDGTTLTGFKNGLLKYVTEQGYSLTYQSVRTSNTTVNMDTVRQAFNNDKVVLLCFSNYNLISGFALNDDSAQICCNAYSAGHMMVTYRFKTIAYYKDGVNFRTDTYFYIVSGYDTELEGYTVLFKNSTLTEALIVYIT